MSIAMEDQPRRHRITVDEYHRMAEVGLLAPDARVELIDGEIIDMPPIGSAHAATVDQLYRVLYRAVGERAIIRCRGPVRLSDLSEAQPDFALLAPRKDRYRGAHPSAADVLLAVEVADTTLNYDLHRKRSLYARCGVREFWVLDLVNQRLHVHRNPAGAMYEQTSTLDAPPPAVELSALPGTFVEISSVFGDR